jgi:predicted dehydrogenase
MTIQHKIIVAGCGGMAQAWVAEAKGRHNAEIVAFVDLYEATAQAMAERHQLDVPIFTDLSAALASTDANLVFDVTIPASHKHIVTTALRAGVHVLGEKPMAESLQDAEEIVRTSEQTGKRYAVMQNRRYLKTIRAYRDFVQSGQIGDIGSIHANFFLGPHFGGFRDAMDNPLILDMAIHTFDQARFITGADPVSVYCHGYNPPGSWYKGNASASCIFEMDNGIVFSYNGSWCAQGLGTSWEAEWRVNGSKGSAEWDGINLPVGEAVVEGATEGFQHPLQQLNVPATYQGREMHQGCFDEMFASLEEDRPAETDCRDNIKSMWMVFGAVESARTGEKVML